MDTVEHPSGALTDVDGDLRSELTQSRSPDSDIHRQHA
jgi:hypothetical protein